MSKTTRRALGVIRLSELTDESTSSERQREIISNAAALRESEIVDWAEDLDVSASKYPPTRRPELARRLADPAAFDEIIFWRIDRFVRSPADLTDMIRWSKANGKGLLSATESFDLDDPLGEAMAYLASIFAKMESAANSVRTTGSQDYLRRNGRWRGGRVPYGYRPAPNPDGKGIVLVPNGETASVVREAVRRVIAGESVSSLVIDLNRRGIAPPLGKARAWHDTGLRRILQNRALIGHVMHNGEVVTGDDGMPLTFTDDPLISSGEWGQLQRALSEASVTPRRTAGASMLLNVAQCRKCGGPLYLWTKERKYSWYRCRNAQGYRNGQPKSCDAKVIKVADLHAEVDARINRELTGPDVRQVITPGDNHDAEIASVKAAMTELTSQLTREVITDDAYDAKMPKLRAKLAELKALPATPDQPIWVQAGGTVAGAWNSLTDDQQRRRFLLERGITVKAQRDSAGRLVVNVKMPQREVSIIR